MVTRRKLRTFVTALALYLGAAALIGYFGVNAWIGDHGLKAKQHLDQTYAELSAELEQLKQERAAWQRRVSLLKAESIDPDALDERARRMLNHLHPNEVTMMLGRP